MESLGDINRIESKVQEQFCFVHMEEVKVKLAPERKIVFSPDDTGYEIFHPTGTKNRVFVETESYGGFMGNQENDVGLHIPLLNRMPTEIASRKEVTDQNEPYDVPNIQLVRDAINAFDNKLARSGRYNVLKADALSNNVLKAGCSLETVVAFSKPHHAEATFYEDVSAGVKFPVSFTYTYDTTKLKQVQGAVRNDRSSTGTNHLVMVIPDEVKTEFVDKTIEAVGLKVDKSQQINVSLATMAMSWMPSMKSPMRFELGDNDLAVYDKAFDLFRNGLSTPKAKPSGGWSGRWRINITGGLSNKF